MSCIYFETPSIIMWKILGFKEKMKCFNTKHYAVKIMIIYVYLKVNAPSDIKKQLFII